MKGDRSVRSVLALAVMTAAVLGSVAACTNPVLSALTAMSSKSFGLAGTWGNNAFTANTYLPQCYRLTINSDGTIVTRSNMATQDSGTYTIASVSVSGNTRTYTFRTDQSYLDYYVLARVTGTTLEIQTNGASYPTAINPTDSMNYGTYTAQ